MGYAEPVPWIESFAARTGLRYEPDADERWLRAWEPYTTLRVAIGYAHALQATGEAGSISIARMTVAGPPRPSPTGGPPLESEARCWIAIVQDSRLQGKAATTSDMGGVFGEPFDLIGYPRRMTGDPVFDRVFGTFAADPAELEKALTPSLRKLLIGWRTPVHAEVRPGGFVLAPVALAADPSSLTWLLDAVRAFGNKAAKIPTRA